VSDTTWSPGRHLIGRQGGRRQVPTDQRIVERVALKGCLRCWSGRPSVARDVCHRHGDAQGRLLVPPGASGVAVDRGQRWRRREELVRRVSIEHQSGYDRSRKCASIVSASPICFCYRHASCCQSAFMTALFIEYADRHRPCPQARGWWTTAEAVVRAPLESIDSATPRCSPGRIRRDAPSKPPEHSIVTAKGGACCTENPVRREGHHAIPSNSRRPTARDL